MLRCRDQITDPIDAATVTVDGIEAALRTLSTIENVVVSAPAPFTGTTLACGTPGPAIQITFRSPSGNVPLINFVTGVWSAGKEHCRLGLGPLAVVGFSAICCCPFLAEFTGAYGISLVADGTTDYLECSGRGLCNRKTGTCKCFIGYGSSDGGGNKGQRDDCGVRVAYDPAFQFQGAGWESRVRDQFREWQRSGRDDREFRLGSPFGRDNELDHERDRGWHGAFSDGNRGDRDFGFERDWKRREEQWRKREDWLRRNEELNQW